jgi:hypothetical protein
MKRRGDEVPTTADDDDNDRRHDGDTTWPWGSSPTLDSV